MQPIAGQPGSFILTDYAFARPCLKPKWSDVGVDEEATKEEGETVAAQILHALAALRMRAQLNARRRRSRKWRAQARDARRDVARVEAIAPSQAKTVCWRKRTQVQFGDWIDDAHYDTVEVGRRARRAAR